MSARKKSNTLIDKQHLYYHPCMDTVRGHAKHIVYMERAFAKFSYEEHTSREWEKQVKTTLAQYEDAIKDALYNMHRHEIKEILYHAREEAL